MADNVDITPGSGATVATDDVAGAQYQRVKLTDGTPNGDNHAVVEDTGSLRVALADLMIALRVVFNAIARPIWYQPSNNAIRTEVVAGTISTVSTVSTVSSVTSMTTLTTVGTVNAVTTVNQINGLPIRDVLYDPLFRQVWALTVRGRIS